MDLAVEGKLPKLSRYDGENYLTTMLLAHYEYEEVAGKRRLRHLTLAALPNGLLQDQYNPNIDDTIWSAGRNAPTRGEDFRVRLSFPALVAKEPWRVQRVSYMETKRMITAEWNEGPVETPTIEGDDNE